MPFFFHLLYRQFPEIFSCKNTVHQQLCVKKYNVIRKRPVLATQGQSWVVTWGQQLANVIYSLAHIRYHPGIVQQAQGCSAAMVVSPHHNYQSTINSLGSAM
jgi:hypothetical protein